MLFSSLKKITKTLIKCMPFNPKLGLKRPFIPSNKILAKVIRLLYLQFIVDLGSLKNISKFMFVNSFWPFKHRFINNRREKNSLISASFNAFLQSNP